MVRKGVFFLLLGFMFLCVSEEIEAKRGVSRRRRKRAVTLKVNPDGPVGVPVLGFNVGLTFGGAKEIQEEKVDYIDTTQTDEEFTTELGGSSGGFMLSGYMLYPLSSKLTLTVGLKLSTPGFSVKGEEDIELTEGGTIKKIGTQSMAHSLKTTRFSITAGMKFYLK